MLYIYKFQFIERFLEDFLNLKFNRIFIRYKFNKF